MKLTIIATPKEIAALALDLQGRRKEITANAAPDLGARARLAEALRSACQTNTPAEEPPTWKDIDEANITFAELDAMLAAVRKES